MQANALSYFKIQVMKRLVFLASPSSNLDTSSFNTTQLMIINLFQSEEEPVTLILLQLLPQHQYRIQQVQVLRSLKNQVILEVQTCTQL